MTKEHFTSKGRNIIQIDEGRIKELLVEVSKCLQYRGKSIHSCPVKKELLLVLDVSQECNAF